MKPRRVMIADYLRQFPAFQPEAIRGRIEAQLNATRTVVAITRGEITDTLEVPDFHERRQAINMVLMLDNQYPARQLQIDQSVRVEQLHDLSLQFASLPVERMIELTAIPVEEVPSADADSAV